MDASEFLTNDFWQSPKNVVFSNDSNKLSLLHSLLATLDLENKSLMFFESSGTTGLPKWIGIKKNNFLNSAKAVNLYLKPHFKDLSKASWSCVLPLNHVGGVSIFARAYLSGARVYDHRPKKKWDPCLYINQIKEDSCALSSLVPTHIYDLLDKKQKIPETLKAVFVGGAYLQESLYFKAIANNFPLKICYGMTETSSQFACSEWNASLSRVKKYPLMKLHSHARLEKCNEAGRYNLFSNSLCEGVLDLQKKKYIKVTEPYFLEDILKVNSDMSFLKVVGRSDDLFKVHGEWVDLSQHAKLLEKILNDQSVPYCFLKVPCMRAGFKVVLCVQEGVTLQSDDLKVIVDSLNQQLPAYQRISTYRLFQQLPRLENQKIDKQKLIKAFS